MTTRAEALQALSDGDQRLRALLQQLTHDDIVKEGMLAGGHWSAKDLLGHVAFWEELALSALDAWRAGSLPPRPDVDEMNEDNHERSRHMPLEDVEERYETAHNRLTEEIASLSDDEWTARRARADSEQSLGDLLGGITSGDKPFDHAGTHLPDLEAYVASALASG